MFKLTAAAAAQILRAVQDEPDQEMVFLRVAAKIDNDELVYGMGFDEERENDLILESEGIRLLISPRSQEYLETATLDFVELRPGEFQFIFVNPQDAELRATRQRGDDCGTCGGGGD